jgi:allantoicase
VTHVRLDVFPDGGLSRLNVHGELEPAALEQMRRRWRDALPAGHSRFR